MPIYEYACLKCGRQFEMMQKASDAPLTRCTECKGKLEKQWSQTSMQFKGAGWYVNDYAPKKSGGEKSGDEKSSDSKQSDGEKKADADKKTGSKESKPSENAKPDAPAKDSKTSTESGNKKSTSPAQTNDGTK